MDRRNLSSPIRLMEWAVSYVGVINTDDLSSSAAKVNASRHNQTTFKGCHLVLTIFRGWELPSSPLQ